MLIIHPILKAMNDFRKLYFCDSWVVSRRRSKTQKMDPHASPHSGDFRGFLLDRYQQQSKNLQGVKSLWNDLNSQKELDWFEKWIISVLPLRARILDVGCGIGMYGKCFAEHNRTSGWEYYGLEMSDEVVKLCQQFYPEGSFICGDARKMNFENNTFDLVMLSGVLHCIPDAWAVALNECKRITKNLLMISRIPLVEKESSFQYDLMVQRRKRKRVTQRMLALNRLEFESQVMSAGLQILNKEISNEKIYIGAYPRKVLTYRYILKKG